MPLETRVGQLLNQHKLTLTVAESCTGGLVCHRLTDVAGSSAYLLGGVVSYSNTAKMAVLDVKAATLAEVGAVSARTAAEMAQGVKRVMNTDIGISTTGILGPGGGSAEKPVGLVYMHLSAHDAEIAERHTWSGDRQQNKAASAEAVLALLERYLTSLSAGML